MRRWSGMSKLSQRASIALAHADDEWPVYPIRTDKRPLVKGGFTAGTTEPGQILAWWRKWPNANVAARVPDGILALDLDRPEAWEAVGLLDLPQTRTHVTANGEHWLYAVEDDEFRASVVDGITLRPARK